MIKVYNISFIINESELESNQQSRRQQVKQLKVQKQSTHSYSQNCLILSIYQKTFNIQSSHQQPLLSIKLNKSSIITQQQIIYQQSQTTYQYTIKMSQNNKSINPKILYFQLCSFQIQSTNTNNHIISSGQLNLHDTKSTFVTIPAYNHSNHNIVHGFLSLNYIIYDQNHKPINILNHTLPLYIFAVKIFIHNPRNYKRAFLTLSQTKSNNNHSNNKSNHFQNISNQHSQNQQQNQSAINYRNKVIKLSLKRIQKGWIWYPKVFQFQIQLQSTNLNSSNIQLNLYSFDFNTNQKDLICFYKGPLFIDFSKHDQVKFTQLQMKDYQLGSDDCIATIQFKYCQKLQNNHKKINDMNSKTYIQNAFSPSQFMYDSNSFISNLSIAKDKQSRLDKSQNLSKKNDLNNSQILNLNKMNRNIFFKSKFHSIFISNRGIAIDRQQRFTSNKKLTDQLGYYAHQTIDINSLPKRQRYRYASFGKDTKQCLKRNAFQCIGPGSGRYKLPSIFDKY